MIRELFCRRIERQHSKEFIFSRYRNTHRGPQGRNCSFRKFAEIQHRIRIQNRLTIRRDPATQTFSARDPQVCNQRSRFAGYVFCNKFIVSDVIHVKHRQREWNCSTKMTRQYFSDFRASTVAGKSENKSGSGAWLHLSCEQRQDSTQRERSRKRFPSAYQARGSAQEQCPRTHE